jgi:hypothetical protein
LQRLIQTTIANEHSENAISVIFVSNTSSDDVANALVLGPYHGGAEDKPRVQHRDEAPKAGHIQTLRSLGLQNIIDLPLSAVIDVPWMVNAFFSGDYENTDTDLIAYVLDSSVLVIEQSPAELTS